MKIFQKNNFGWFVVLGLSIFPIFLWLIYPTPFPRFSSLTLVMASIGQILGLVGTAMFAISLILSARFRFLEKYLHGLNMVYVRHNQLGQISFILLLFHPLFLIPKYAGGSMYYAAVFLVPAGNWPLNWGLFSLAIMILLIVLTLYLRPRYDLWRWTHKFLGFSFFLAAIHFWLIPSDMTRYMPLQTYILGLSFLGMLVFTYKTIFGKFLVKRFKYVITEVLPLNKSVVKITLEPVEEQMKFNAGQFVFMSFIDSNLSTEEHPFSVASSPDEKGLVIIAKDLGDFTRDLAKLAVGSWALIEGPFGVFSYKNAEFKDQIWISGGIGITPFLSMAKSLKLEENYNIDLYYCLNSKCEAILLDQLDQISISLKNSFRAIPFCADKVGFINADVIEEISSSLDYKDIFFCAPPPMIKSLRTQFAKRGIDENLLHSEDFNFS